MKTNKIKENEIGDWSIETPTELLDPYLLGNIVKEVIELVVPDFILFLIKRHGCNCEKRKEYLNNLHLRFRNWLKTI